MEFHEHPKRFLERLLNSQQLRKNALENKISNYANKG